MGLTMPQGSPPSTTANITSPTQSRYQPKICIIGAGMGGLTCALALAKRGFTNISVYEAASSLGFVGAGIQLAPNMARVLDRLGVWSAIEKEAVTLHDTSIRDGQTDSELANVQLDYINDDYGYHHMVGHRHSLANGLYQGCLQHPNAVTFHFAMTISSLDSFDTNPHFLVTPRDESLPPSTVQCDILLGCDGIKSPTRSALLSALHIPPSEAKVQDTSQAAYRIMIPRALMLSSSNPALHQLIDTPRATRWIAAKRHVIAYPISNHSIYNLSTVQPDTNFSAAPSATYTTRGSKKAMLDVFADFCPTVRNMLQLVPEGEVCEWKLRVHSPLPTWVCGSVALVGDACHPTLPHLAQGAAQAIEDAAVVAACLQKIYFLSNPSPSSLPSSSVGISSVPTREEINKALRIYETVRKPRAENLVSIAADSGRALHLSESENDESARRERDRLFAALRENDQPDNLSHPEKIQGSAGVGNGGKKGGESATVPDKWADREVQKLIYGVDCEDRVEREWVDLWNGV